jgi:nucleoid-associated protein YgaU
MSLHHYYVIQPGDTLSGIARAFTGRAGNYRYLAALNGISDPDWIYAGNIIFLD